MPMIFRGPFCLLGSIFLACAACSEGNSDSEPGAAGSSSGAAGKGGESSQTAGSAGVGGTGTGGASAAGASAAGSSQAGAAGTGAEAGNGAGGDDGAGGAGSGEQVVEACLDAPVLGETRTEALRFSAAGLTLGVVRRADPDSVGTSGTTPWLPQRFAISRGAVAECVSELAALDYTSSYHNFDDRMSAQGESETWVFQQVRESYDHPTVFSVEGRDGDTLLWGPTMLTLLSCHELSFDQSCSATYQ